MIPVSDVRVYLAPGVTDMRKAINGLSILIQEQLKLDPFSGHLFAFCNRKRDIIKVLYWDQNGFCLWQKRLERERFRWPVSREDILRLDMRELLWIIDGLSIPPQEAHVKLQYDTVL